MLQAPFRSARILTGPTGTGKTALALDLAERLGAEIVSMDSMSLYRGMDIGTAKPSLADLRQVPHHLIDVLDPSESASVAWWLQRAAAACADIVARGKVPLIVGGTPLYLKAILFGLFEGPARDVELRRRLEDEAARTGTAALHARLAAHDPAAAQRIHPNDLRRIVRALEVHELTGRPMSAWQSQWPSEPRPGEEAAFVWLDIPRPVLYERIERRVDAMFAAGLVEEVRRLSTAPRPLSREAAQALGYREVLSHLAGQVELEETIALVKTHSRQYAKRQLTWFRHLPGGQAIAAPAPELTVSLWSPTMNASRR